MKKVLLIYLLLLCFSCAPKNKNGIDGAYQRSEFKFGDMKEWDKDKDRKVLKIFSDGYWMGFFYDDKRSGKKLFDGAGGGTYKLENDQYLEDIDFYSWDSTAIGKEFTLNYKSDENVFQQFGTMNSEKYPDYPVNEKFNKITSKEMLKSDALEGVWEMTEGTWGGQSKFGEGKYKNATVRMIFQYPKMAVAYFSKPDKSFDGAGLFTYQYDGNTFSEYCEAYSWDSTHVGFKGNFQLKVDGDTFTKTSKDWEGFKEVFKRIK